MKNKHGIKMYYYHGTFVVTTNIVVNCGYCNKTMVHFCKRLPGCCSPKGETLAYFLLTDLLTAITEHL